MPSLKFVVDFAVNPASTLASALAVVWYKFVVPSERSSVSFVANWVLNLGSNVELKSLVANLVAILFVIVVEKLASSPIACANSFNVSNAPGDESIKASTFNCALASALASV